MVRHFEVRLCHVSCIEIAIIPELIEENTIMTSQHDSKVFLKQNIFKHKKMATVKSSIMVTV